MYKSVAIILVLLVVLVAVSVHGVVHIHALPLSALAWGEVGTGSTLATITVNSTSDVAADDGQCTLREAMIAANTDTASGGASGECAAGLGDDTIDLTGVTGAIDLTGALPSIASGIALNGPGADGLTVRRSTVENYRIFEVAAGMTATLSGLTVDNGSLVSEHGGGIYNGGTLVLTGTVISGSSAYLGGGIFNVGTLTLTNSTVSGNSAEQGGGIDNDAGVVALIGSTISGNQATSGGGGIANVGGSATLTSTTVAGNSADHGGGINNVGTLLLDGSTVSGNEAASDGGGISNHTAGLAELTNCTVSGNGASSGGGISNDLNSRVELTGTTVIDNNVSDDGGGIDNSGTLTLYSSTISGNESTDGSGGGVSNVSGGALTLIDSTVSGNSVDFSGGGIYNSDSTLELTGSTVISNVVTNGYGGGIYSTGQAVVTLNDSAVSDNSAGGGGGIVNRDGTVALTGSAVSGNDAQSGGGILNRDGRMTLTNSSISGNSAEDEGGITNSGMLTVTGTTISHNGNDGGVRNTGAVTVTNSTINHNDIGIYNFRGTAMLINSTISGNERSGVGNFEGLVTLISTIVGAQDPQPGNVAHDCGGPITSLGYNLDSDGTCNLTATGDITDTDPLLGALDDNGGPTFTQALLSGSPAIDAIPVESCTDHLGASITTDQRGVQRPQGSACDIGAFEEIKNVLYLPLVLDNYLAPAAFPLHIGDAIPVRPVVYQGEIFYVASIHMSQQLPSGGHFYLSSRQDAVAAALVDDAMAILLDGSEVFTHAFSSGDTPEPAIVEVPRATMEQVAGETVTVEYRDVYGSVVQASAIWLIWTP